MALKHGSGGHEYSKYNGELIRKYWKLMNEYRFKNYRNFFITNQITPERKTLAYKRAKDKFIDDMWIIKLAMLQLNTA
jgi:hypothetical protein